MYKLCEFFWNMDSMLLLFFFWKSCYLAKWIFSVYFFSVVMIHLDIFTVNLVLKKLWNCCMEIICVAWLGYSWVLSQDKTTLEIALRMIYNVELEDEGMDWTTRNPETHNTCKSQDLFTVFLSLGYISQSLHFSIHGNGIFFLLSS